MDSKARADNKHVAGHEHRASVYVRCRDCLMFGIPMPGEFQCGNCNSHNTVSYLPPCCLEAAVKEAREQGMLDAIPNADKNWAEMHKHEIAESFSQGAEFVKQRAMKIVVEYDGADPYVIADVIKALPTSQPICTAVMCFCGKHYGKEASAESDVTGEKA